MRAQETLLRHLALLQLPAAPRAPGPSPDTPEAPAAEERPQPAQPHYIMLQVTTPTPGALRSPTLGMPLRIAEERRLLRKPGC